MSIKGDSGRTGTVSVIPVKKGNFKKAAWDFTWHWYTSSDVDELVAWFDDDPTIKDFIFQEEIGPKSGIPHLQGGFLFKNARSYNAVLKYTGDLFTNFKNFSFRKCKKNWYAIKNYCSKGRTRKPGGRLWKKAFRVVLDPLADLEYRPWQKQLAIDLDGPIDKDKIIWYVDTDGGWGKTTFAKHWCLKYPGKVLYMSGKSADCKYGIASWLEKNPEADLETVFFDYTRSIEMYVSYQAIEEIKNAIFFNSKYESGMVMYNKPHVVVFANFAPDKMKMSTYKWDVRTM